MASEYVVQGGDTWASIALARLGNATLGSALAGQNGYNATSDPPVGARIWLTITEANPRSPVLLLQLAARVTRAEFVDDGGVSGHLDLPDRFPAGALLLGFAMRVREAFVGGGGSGLVNFQLGEPAVPGRWSGNLVVSVAGFDGTDCFGNAAPYCQAPIVPRLTVTAQVDFTTVVGGDLELAIAYLDTAKLLPP